MALADYSDQGQRQEIVRRGQGDPGTKKVIREEELGPRSYTADARVPETILKCSVADPGCLSRIPDPDFYPSRIPDPKTRKKERGEKKFVVITFYVATNFTKLFATYFSFEVLKKKIWANFQRIIELFTQKIVTKLSKRWVWDPGSEIRDPEKPYSGSRIQETKRHRIRIRIRNTDKMYICSFPGNKKNLPGS